MLLLPPPPSFLAHLPTHVHYVGILGCQHYPAMLDSHEKRKDTVFRTREQAWDRSEEVQDNLFLGPSLSDYFTKGENVQHILEGRG